MQRMQPATRGVHAGCRRPAGAGPHGCAASGDDGESQRCCRSRYHRGGQRGTHTGALTWTHTSLGAARPSPTPAPTPAATTPSAPKTHTSCGVADELLCGSARALETPVLPTATDSAAVSSPHGHKCAPAVPPRPLAASSCPARSFRRNPV
jgi:hypothetical protein